MTRLLSPAIIALLIAANADAETVYVTDILRLGIHRATDTSDRAFDSLISGMPLEVLERNVNYARVRLQDGREGWVKAAYLVAEKPAQLRVAEVQAELEALREQMAAAEAVRSAAEQEAAQLVERLETREGSTSEMRASLAQLKRQNEEYEARFERYRTSLPWLWSVAAVLVTLIGGFAAGWWWLDASIRRRHGGFRIY
jgi:SH3 domain protein